MKIAYLTIEVCGENSGFIEETVYVNVDSIVEFHYIPKEKKTIISLTGENNYVYVKETPQEVIKAIKESDNE